MNVLALKITPSYVCGYQIDSTKPRTRLQELAAKTNFEKAYTQGVMTDSVAKKIKTKLEVWLHGIEYQRLVMNEIGLTTVEYPTFITLTLSKPQMDDDIYIKRELLMRYIELLKKRYGIINYYWRAEKKIGKRIHFHLIVDKYIKWQDIRREWNTLQSHNGYHDILDSYNNDLGNNSTDIDKVKGGDAITKYLTKYVSKSEEGERIEGRIWGCSAALHTIGACVMLATPQLQSCYVKMLYNEKLIKKEEPTYTVIYWKNTINLKSASYELFKIYREHCISVYRTIYLGQTVVQSPVKLSEGLPRLSIKQKRGKGVERQVVTDWPDNCLDLFANEKKIVEFAAFDCFI